MKRMTVIGSLVGLFLLVFMVSLSFGADPPEYDATGTWDYQATAGWSDCSRSLNPDVTDTFAITQSGSTFTILSGGLSGNGKIVGSRYQIFTRGNTVEGSMSTALIWNLDSSSIGNGHTASVLMDDESSICSTVYDLHLQKQGDCTPTDTRMCLQNGRVSVRVSWEDEHGNTGDGHAIPSTDDSGLFWFFSKNNMELLIKVLNGCSINNRYWVFFAATTDQKFTVRVTDLSTDDQVEYTNPLKHAADAVTDTSAFATCP